MRNTTATTTSSTSVPMSNKIDRSYKLRYQIGFAVWVGRIVFVVCLCFVMSGLGVGALFILRKAERQLAEMQYESIVERALKEASTFAFQRLMATVTMASFVSVILPDADPWPFVTVPAFKQLATNLEQTSSGAGIAFVPIVYSDQIESFEDFAYDFYEMSGFPSGTGTSSFGEGMYGINHSKGTPDGRYRATDGTTDYGSPNDDILTPLLQVSLMAEYLMYNIHANPELGRAIDKIVNCSLYSQHAGGGDHEDNAPSDPSNTNCAAITETLTLPNKPNSGPPTAAIIQPIFPANDPNTLTGFITNQLVWEEMFDNSFGETVSGIDCVLHEIGGQSHTYSIVNGVANYTGESDAHRERNNPLERCIEIASQDHLYAENSPNYSLCLYPTSDFYRSYETRNPEVACGGTIAVILFTSLLFFFYDFCVRRHVSQKQELLQAKRDFMRFVSHEVRTPLSAVSMGLKLMQNDIASSVGSDVDVLLQSTKEPQGGDDEVHDEVVNETEGEEEECPEVMKPCVSTKDALNWYKMVNQLQSNTLSAVNVLNDLLNYDKIESGELKLERTVIPIWDLINATVREFQLAAERKHLVLEYQDIENDEESLQVKGIMANNKLVGDSVRITQVLRNLISNAIKFSNENETIAINARWMQSSQGDEMDSFVLRNGETCHYQRSGFLRVSVRDSGAGMTREQLQKLFVAGMQFNVNELQAGKGSGLGLYIAKGIAEQHNGSLVALSDGLGRGSVFTLTLPLHHVPPESIATLPVSEYVSQASIMSTVDNVSSKQVGENKSEQTSSLRLLVVDDATSNRKLLCRLLEKRGHTCDQAVDGNEALERVQESFYDAVLLDYEMPVMNGPEAAQRMRGMGSDVFIVGITGNLLPEDIKYFMSCGADAVLPKPLEIHVLEQLLAGHGASMQQ